MLLAVETASAEAVATPSGWTEHPLSPQSTSEARLSVFYRFAPASPAAPTITDPGNHAYAVITAWRGVDLADPFDVSDAGSVTPGSQSNIVFTGSDFTTTVPDTLCIIIVADSRDSSTTTRWSSHVNASLASIAERHDGGTSQGHGGGIGIFSGTKAAAGAVNNWQADHFTGAELFFSFISIALQPPAGTPEGSVAGSVSWVGSVSGTRVSKGEANGSISWVGSVTGTRTPKGEANGSISWVGSVDGVAPAIVMDGSVAGSISWVGSVTGTRVPKGEANGSISWVGSVTGTRISLGSVAGAIEWVGAVAGARTPKGSAGGAIDWVGVVTGTKSSQGAVTGAIGWVGTVTGEQPPDIFNGSVEGSVSWVGVVTGTRTPKGSVVGGIVWAGEVTGASPRAGTVLGAIEWPGTVSGARESHGEASGGISWVGLIIGIAPAEGVGWWEHAPVGVQGSPVGWEYDPVPYELLD